jgi:curved DNA-binding protein CbpA
MISDYYGILEISPNANSDTIERIFRHLARRYHPDNQDTGDATRFGEVVDAYNTLKDPARRAQYDIQHKDHAASRAQLADEVSNALGIGEDVATQDKLLSVLYVKRRQDMKEPGISDYELELLSGCPREHLQFHLWYLRGKGWVERMENGMVAITVEGVDHANNKHTQGATKLLTHSNRAG